MMCHQKRWSRGGWIWWGVPHRLEKGISASENAGPRRGVDCEIPMSVGEENGTPFRRVWKLLPSRLVLKILIESPKRTISTSGSPRSLFW